MTTQTALITLTFEATGDAFRDAREAEAALAARLDEFYGDDGDAINPTRVRVHVTTPEAAGHVLDAALVGLEGDPLTEDAPEVHRQAWDAVHELSRPPLVRRLLTALAANGVPAEWHHTGGGCYAVRVPFPGGAEVLITDAEDALAADHLEDRDPFGWFAARYDGSGDADGDVYVTPDAEDAESTFGPLVNTVAHAFYVALRPA